MAVKASIRPADELVGPAVSRAVAAYDPPEQDAPLVALARSLARVIDVMPESQRPTMLAQATGQLLKVLGELDDRARRRGQADPKAVDRLDELRTVRARRPGAI